MRKKRMYHSKEIVVARTTFCRMVKGEKITIGAGTLGVIIQAGKRNNSSVFVTWGKSEIVFRVSKCKIGSP